MTALSKEDVMRALEALESMDDFARMDAGVDPVGPYKVLRDFIEARADLVAENERLKSIPMKYRRMAFNAELQDEADKLRTALAAAESKLLDATCNFVSVMAVVDKNSDAFALAKQGHDELDQPRDDSALREMIAGVYEECVKVPDDVPIRVGNAGIWGVDVKKAIRALSLPVRHGS